MYLFICGLFNDAVSSLDYKPIASTSDRMVNEKIIGKDMEGSDRDLI
jgi:hypothetical protein